jgi:phosphatidylglycerol:prolipoprotein diacylglycerol transferase
LAIEFPRIDPVAVNLPPSWIYDGEPFAQIHWYALSYVAGIVLGWWYIGKLDRREPKAFSKQAYDDFIIWAVFGVLLGGRLGYVLFYNAEYYLQHPGSILNIWEGGMSFHGGLIGSIVAMWLMCKKYQLKLLPVVDIVACSAPIGLFFGRIANFINSELWGRQADADVSWAVIFPGHAFARHPSQLYEAALEGGALFFIMLFAIKKTKLAEKPGALAGLFIIGYGIFRSIVEFYREPDAQLGYFFGVITMGQILCIPMVVLGVFLINRKVANEPA